MRGAEFAQHIEAAEGGQHDVQYYQLECVSLQFGQGFAAVVHALDLEMLGFQILREHLTQFAVVIDQQHAVPCCGILGCWGGSVHESPYCRITEDIRRIRTCFDSS
jgi:hypothetical protein